MVTGSLRSICTGYFHVTNSAAKSIFSPFEDSPAKAHVQISGKLQRRCVSLSRRTSQKD